MRVVLVVAVLSLVLASAAGAEPAPWLPQESWPGGRQYDARLEKPVHLWLTGTPLAQVFSSLQQQTGVALGFFPAADDNARICVNIYLNPKQPPTLRELMTQLAWVLDCNFGVSGEGEGRTYALLSTSIGSKVIERLQAEANRRAREAEPERERLLREKLTIARARLEEIRGARGLSREEAIRKYRGKDDQVLLVLLDPARRALSRFLLSLSESDWDSLPQARSIEYDGAELTPEQQAWLGEAAGATGIADVYLELWESGAFEGTVSVATGREQQGQSRDLPRMYLAAGPDAKAQAEIAVRKALGELSDGEEQRLTAEASRRAQQEADRKRVEEQIAQLAHVSAENAARLGKTTLPVKLEEPHALWQIQELVAARTGMHVVSDAFWQPARSLQMALDAMPVDSKDEPTAWEALRLSCVALTPGDSAPPREWLRAMRPADAEGVLARWEWGDAGDFLRFRSPERDVWRGAFLSRKALATFEAWAAPHLPQDPAELAKLLAVTIPINPWRVARVLADLTEPQRRWGGMLTYAEPTDARALYQHAMRGGVLRIADRARYAFQLLSAMSAEQWQRLDAEGLRWGEDVSIAPAKPGPDAWYWSNFTKGDRIAFADKPAEPYSGAPLPSGSSTSSRWLAFHWRGGRATEYDELPLDIVLRPEAMKHLVPQE